MLYSALMKLTHLTLLNLWDRSPVSWFNSFKCNLTTWGKAMLSWSSNPWKQHLDESSTSSSVVPCQPFIPEHKAKLGHIICFVIANIGNSVTAALGNNGWDFLISTRTVEVSNKDCRMGLHWAFLFAKLCPGSNYNKRCNNPASLSTADSRDLFTVDKNQLCLTTETSRDGRRQSAPRGGRNGLKSLPVLTAWRCVVVLSHNKVTLDILPMAILTVWY